MAGVDKSLVVLGWFVLITLMCAIARQLSEQIQLDLTPSLFGRVNGSHKLLERFENGSDTSISGIPDTNVFNPAESKASYTLLNDVLKAKESAGTLTSSARGGLREAQSADTLTAKTCYEKDFLAQTAKTGNYIQRTNNYRHGAPDNCSAPLTEFVGSFYKNP